jgi:hypothetical protein
MVATWRVPAPAGTGLYSAVPASPSRQAVSAHSGGDPSRGPPALLRPSTVGSRSGRDVPEHVSAGGAADTSTGRLKP